jgi:osmotically-inducible protein OsmY
MKLLLITLGLLAAIGCQGSRDRSPVAAVLLDPRELEADYHITQQARDGVEGNDDLSTAAKTIQIATSEGVVTLVGPVASQEEKSTIARIVKKIAGVTTVVNQLAIAAR